MEKTVRILSQSALQSRQYVDKKTGEQKVLNSVTLKLTEMKAIIRLSIFTAWNQILSASPS